MAGKRQHYIMRLLFNGFAYRTQGENSFVWCFRKDIPPFPTNTLNVGLETGFYGQPGKGSLDDLITEKLGAKHSPCIVDIRKTRALNPADEETLVDFVHTVVIRPQNPRKTALIGVNSVLSQLSSVSADVTTARRWLLNEVRKATPLGDHFLTEYVRMKHGVQNSQRERYLKWKERENYKRWILQDPEAAERIQQLTVYVKEQYRQFLGQLEELAKTSHNNILKKTLQQSGGNATPRYNYYRQLHWTVQSVESEPLILGDVAVLQFDRRSGKFSAAFDGIKGDVILLPLSHDLLIVGSTEDTKGLPSIHEINCNSAELSFDFFVASQNTEREKEYQKLLGRRTFRPPKIFA